MPVHERRQHFRIDDKIYFDYKVIENTDLSSDETIIENLIGQRGKKYLEARHYFQGLESELAEFTQTIALRDPALAHYLNLLNAKVDYLAANLLLGEKIRLRKVSISLGGMSFKTKERIKEKTRLKMVIYAKPKLLPVFLDAIVVYSQFHNEKYYRTAVQFGEVNREQEERLSQHIMLAQIKCSA